MSTPAAKKGRTVLQSSDPCPRGCPSLPGKAVHLLSDHVVEQGGNQCTKCACVIQDVSDIKAP